MANEVEVQNAVNSALDEQKKKKKKKRLIVLGVIGGIVLLIIIVSSLGGGSKSEDMTPALTITADEIIGDYKNNSVSADEKYKDKYLKVTDCTVTNIDDGYFYVNAKDDNLIMYQLSVNYADDQKDIAKTLSENEIVTVVGKCTGTTVMGDARLENAKIIVDESKTTAAKTTAKADSKDTSSEEITVTADKLIGDYKNNALSADESYKGKVLTITKCTVKDIESGHFYVDAIDDDLWLTRMEVKYSDDQSSTVSKLSENDVVTIKGTCSGTDMFDYVVIKDAKVVK